MHPVSGWVSGPAGSVPGRPRSGPDPAAEDLRRNGDSSIFLCRESSGLRGAGVSQPGRAWPGQARRAAPNPGSQAGCEYSGHIYFWCREVFSRVRRWLRGKEGSADSWYNELHKRALLGTFSPAPRRSPVPQCSLPTTAGSRRTPSSGRLFSKESNAVQCPAAAASGDTCRNRLSAVFQESTGTGPQTLLWLSVLHRGSHRGLSVPRSPKLGGVLEN